MSAHSIGPVLSVECGKNRGNLYLRDMAMAIRDQGRVGREPCVEWNNKWFSPNRFMVVSGQDHLHMTWDRLIRHNGVTMKELMEDETVTLDPPQCHCDHCEWDDDIETAHSNNQVVEVSAVYLCEDCDITFDKKREFLLHKKSDHPTQFKSYAGKLQVVLEQSSSVKPSQRSTTQSTPRQNTTPQSAPRRGSTAKLQSTPRRSNASQTSTRQVSTPEVSRRASAGTSQGTLNKGSSTKKAPAQSASQKRKSDAAKEDEDPAPKTPKCAGKTPPPRNNPFTDAKTEDILAELKRRNTTFPCDCGILFTDRALYYLHKGMHSPKNPKMCTFCGYLAENWHDFNSHFFGHGNPHETDEA